MKRAVFGMLCLATAGVIAIFCCRDIDSEVGAERRLELLGVSVQRGAPLMPPFSDADFASPKIRTLVIEEVDNGAELEKLIRECLEFPEIVLVIRASAWDDECTERLMAVSERVVGLVLAGKVTDRSSDIISRMKHLRLLAIYNDSITDRSVDNFARNVGLQVAILNSVKITSAAINNLQKALPDCKIQNDRIPAGSEAIHGENETGDTCSGRKVSSLFGNRCVVPV